MICLINFTHLPFFALFVYCSFVCVALVEFQLMRGALGFLRSRLFTFSFTLGFVLLLFLDLDLTLVWDWWLGF